MTIQHIFYIPAIFLLGFVFGTVGNRSSTTQNGHLQFKTSKKKLLQTFIIFLLVFLVTHIFEIPWGPKVVSQQLGGLELFDKSPEFSGAEVYERISHFTAEGLLAYKRFTYTIDILFPLSFFLFLLTFARFVSERMAIRKYRVLVLMSVPILWFAFDLLENAVIYIILDKYPEQSELLAGALGYISVVKFGLLLLSILTPALLLILANKLKVKPVLP